MAASTALAVDRLAIEPGSQQSLELTVRNTGVIVDEYRVEVVGEPEPWAVVDPPVVSLLPGGEATVTITISPPRSSVVLAGSRPFGIRTTPREQADEVTVEEAELVVLPFLDLSGELLPHTAQAGRWGETQIALDNRGNRPAQVVLSPSDPDEAVEFRLARTTVDVPPGEAAFALLRLRAKKRPFAGRPKTLPIRITAEPDDGEVVEILGAVQQAPRIPRWLARAVLWAGVGLIALLIMWFALLKPTLESTAQEAVERQVSAAQDAAQTAGAAAGDAGEAAGQAGEAAGMAGQAAGAAGAAADAAGAAAGGGDAAAEDAAAAAAAASAQGAASLLRPGIAGNPFDFRLAATAAAGAGAVDSYTVPDEQVLSLTDIVLQNPQGDTGTLQIRRGTGVLLEARLENFRDLDYHFVAPIVYVGGQQVGFAITCQRDDGNPCSAAGYFAGFLTPPPPAPTEGP